MAAFAALERWPQLSERDVLVPWCWPRPEEGFPEAATSREVQRPCYIDNSRPMLMVPNRRGKLRPKAFERQCAPNVPIIDARPTKERSFIHIEPSPLPPTAKVAVLVAGQMRRLSEAGPTWVQHIVVPNRAHVFAATWPIPDDSLDPEASHQWITSQFRDVARDALVAVRVDFTNSRFFINERFQRNSGYQYYLIEAVTRLALGVQARRGTPPYEFFVRVRPDLMVKQSIYVRAPEASGDWYLAVGSASPKQVLASAVVVPSFTFCCMNDWFAVGRATGVMDLYGFVFSLVSMSSNRTVVRLMPLGGRGTVPAPNVSRELLEAAAAPEVLKMSFIGEPCIAESCLGMTLRRSGIPWYLADLPVHIGSDSFGQSRTAPGCPQSCAKL
jgi:hypothetical protein